MYLEQRPYGTKRSGTGRRASKIRLAMSSFSMFVVVFLTVGSAVTVYGEENFNITSNG